MVRLIRGSLTLLACMLVASLGCVKPPPMSKPPDKTLSISSFKEVAGTWEGLVWQKGRDYWYQITIREDGTFEADSRMAYKGHFVEKDQLTIVDGKLRIGTEKEYGVYTLAERDGKKVLLFKAKSKEGITYRGELTHKKSAL